MDGFEKCTHRTYLCFTYLRKHFAWQSRYQKIAFMFQAVFEINPGDIHHAFHRMKDRKESSTSFLDQLKVSVEEFMDNKLYIY